MKHEGWDGVSMTEGAGYAAWGVGLGEKIPRI